MFQHALPKTNVSEQIKEHLISKTAQSNRGPRLIEHPLSLLSTQETNCQSTDVDDEQRSAELSRGAGRHAAACRVDAVAHLLLRRRRIVDKLGVAAAKEKDVLVVVATSVGSGMDRRGFSLQFRIALPCMYRGERQVSGAVPPSA